MPRHYYVVEDDSGNRFKVEITERSGVKKAVAREFWDDTRAPAWNNREFGWVYLLPDEQFALDAAAVERDGEKV